LSLIDLMEAWRLNAWLLIEVELRGRMLMYLRPFL